MDIEIREPDAIGKTKTVCGNCHHRGHRNQATKPCVLNKCDDFTYCGIKEKHPEYFAKLNSFKLEKRKKENEILELENQVKAIGQFATTSEHQFIKNLAPRMYDVDPTYKTNKCKLMRDIRLLRESLDGKMPPVTTNDAEQLGLLIANLRKTKGIAADDSFSLLEDDCPTRDSNQSSDGLKSFHSPLSSSNGEDEFEDDEEMLSNGRKHKKKQRKHPKKKSKDKGKVKVKASKAKGRSKRKYKHVDDDSSEGLSDEDYFTATQKKQKHMFNHHVNPHSSYAYFNTPSTSYMEPYSFVHPYAGRNIHPFHSLYGMNNTPNINESQQIEQRLPYYNHVWPGPASATVSNTNSAYSVHTSINNTSPVKVDLPSHIINQSPNSKQIAQTLLDLGGMPNSSDQKRS
jgi:hypothetical protein